jgi:hypothetical protein
MGTAHSFYRKQVGHSRAGPLDESGNFSFLADFVRTFASPFPIVCFTQNELLAIGDQYDLWDHRTCIVA